MDFDLGWERFEPGNEDFRKILVDAFFPALGGIVPFGLEFGHQLVGGLERLSLVDTNSAIFFLSIFPVSLDCIPPIDPQYFSGLSRLILRENGQNEHLPGMEPVPSTNLADKG